MAAELGSEDGGDPKEFHRKPWDNPKRQGRKAMQLCEQVKEALHFALATCSDPVLQDLTVLSVEPAPHSGRLRTIVAIPGDGEFGQTEAAEHLGRAAGMLRAEVAAAIHRRYTPELVFEVMR